MSVNLGFLGRALLQDPSLSAAPIEVIGLIEQFAGADEAELRHALQQVHDRIPIPGDMRPYNGQATLVAMEGCDAVQRLAERLGNDHPLARATTALMDQLRRADFEWRQENDRITAQMFARGQNPVVVLRTRQISRIDPFILGTFRPELLRLARL